MRMTTIALILALYAPLAWPDSGLSTASELSVEGLSTMGAVPITLLSGVSTLTVDAVGASAEGSVIVRKGGAETGAFVFEISASALGGIVVGVGQTIEVMATLAGYGLMASGELIAFVPNLAVEGMIYHGVHQ